MASFRPSLFLILPALVAAAALPAIAQTPPDLRELVGARAGPADGAILSRRYTLERSQQAGISSLSYFSKAGNCVQTTTTDGRYANIEVVDNALCSLTPTAPRNAALQPPRSATPASPKTSSTTPQRPPQVPPPMPQTTRAPSPPPPALGGPGVVGLNAAIARHNEHHADRPSPSHDNDFARGYQDALYGSPPLDNNDSEPYHSGYLAGDAERSNRRAANSRYVRNGPLGAQDACARRGDDYLEVPPGSSVPVGVIPLGRGDFEVIVASGHYRARCAISADGRVREMTPF